ncbi:Hypothetical predicted protein [Mytilus galloprovincialis]|uniref:DUF5641 domain-containing protein n=1 Tax=Mytilus galloprovincialis TaxID=29158 RepID=A0A8B6EIA3_MYTGA|nr:Hypothetical predicted protein [Mytilus galloprovincialis]
MISWEYCCVSGKKWSQLTADVQHMFHCFVVRKDHRNYLRFLWHKDNDLQKNLVEYRMRVHVFGNSPSPAVATLGLRKAAQASEQEFGSHVTSFVTRDFYVDDGLTSCPTKEEAVKLMKDTQQALAKYGNLRLHKFASNCAEVMSAFHAKTTDHSERNFINDKQSLRSSGFLAPVIIQGKLLLRKIVSETVDWDQPLSDETADEWKSWRDTLIAIETLRIPRTYVPYLSKTATKELHVFSDASEKAIAAVAYLRTTDSSDSGTRSVPAHEIHSSEWLLGPNNFFSSEQKNSEDIYQLIDPEEDGEIRATVNVAKTFSTPEHKGIGTDRFNRFSNWTGLVRAIAFLERFSRLHGSKQASSIQRIRYINSGYVIDTENRLHIHSDHLGEFDKRDLCLAEWRRVQALASVFWSRWRKEYLPLLQQRRKWTEDRRDLIEGDVILLKDKNICRTQWPVGIIVNSFKSSDEHVRKAEVRVIVNGKAAIYTRPIVDMILLIENNPA